LAFKGLFIGIDRYASTGINWLSCAGRDATALHGLFTDTLGGEMKLLTDAQATVATIRERFEQLATASAEDVVVIAFSGHGTETHELVAYAWLAAVYPACTSLGQIYRVGHFCPFEESITCGISTSLLVRFPPAPPTSLPFTKIRRSARSFFLSL
jgi:hypothetical protein